MHIPPLPLPAAGAARPAGPRGAGAPTLPRRALGPGQHHRRHKEGEVLAAKYSVYRNHGSSVIHGIIRLRSIMLTALHAKQQLRTSMDWERVRRKASEIVNRLAYRIPELKGMVLMPSGLFNNVLPISFSPCRRRHRKKQSRRLRVCTLAKSYLQKRSLLFSSHSQESHDEVLSKALNWVADIVDESLKAGKRSELHQQHPLQPSTMKGVTAAPIPQAIFDTLAGLAVNPGTLAALNAGKLTHVPMMGGPLSRTMLGAPISQAVFGTLSGHYKNSGMMRNNAGVTVAPISHTMAAKTTGMPSVANAGTNKHLSQDGCNGKNTHDGFDPRKSQGVVLTTDVGLY